MFWGQSLTPLALQGIPTIGIDGNNTAMWNKLYKENIQCSIQKTADRIKPVIFILFFFNEIQFYLHSKFWQMACQLNKVTPVTLLLPVMYSSSLGYY